MANRINTAACGLTLTVLAFGCGDDGRMIVDSATSTDGSTDSSPGDSSPGDSSGDAADTSTGGATCADFAQGYCTQLMSCDTELLLGWFETIEICREVIEDGCATGGGIPDVPPLEDTAACVSALTSSCSAFFSNAGHLDPRTPDACVTPLGPRALDEACSSDLQCGEGERFSDGATVRLRCTGSAEDIACGAGRCRPPEQTLSSGNICNMARRDPCNFWEAQFCTHEFADEADGITDDPWRCRQVTYGGSGDTCFPTTDQQCGAGFICDTQSRRCMAPLMRDAACDPARDLCDATRLLSCGPNVDGVNVCLGTDYAPVGAQCGTFTEGGDSVTRLCSVYAICSADAVPVCDARRRLTETCSTAPADNCWFGLECRDSTCMEFPPLACP